MTEVFDIESTLKSADNIIQGVKEKKKIPVKKKVAVAEEMVADIPEAVKGEELATSSAPIETLVLHVEDMDSIEPSKAKMIKDRFTMISNKLFEYEKEYNDIVGQAKVEMSKELQQRARRLRLTIKGLRTDAENIRKREKQEYLLAGKAIDGVANIIKWAVSRKEETLTEIEEYYERQEQARREKLQAERAELLTPYLMDTPCPQNLWDMDEAVFNSMLEGQRLSYQRKKEEEARKAEAALLDAIRTRRAIEMARYSDYLDLESVEDWAAFSEEEYKSILEQGEELRQQAQAEQLRQQQELRRQQEEIRRQQQEAQRAKEEAEREARAAQEAIRQKEEAERLAAQHKAAAEARERKAREDAARAEQQAKAAQEQLRKQQEEAQRKAAAEAQERERQLQMSDRERITAWVESFELPDLVGSETIITAEIREKFEGFKRWALVKAK